MSLKILAKEVLQVFPKQKVEAKRNLESSFFRFIKVNKTLIKNIKHILIH
jgi:hypothetical protein